MSDLFSVNFTFRNQPYSALAYFKEIDGKPVFRVTVMNGDLEKLLFGFQLFYIQDGEVSHTSSSVNQDVEELRKVIAHALKQYMPTLARA